MRYFNILYPKASHNTVSGNCDVYNKNCAVHPTHKSATDALYNLYSDKMISDIKLYRVYVYNWEFTKPDNSLCTKTVDWIKRVNTIDKARREYAFSAYRNDTNPQKGMGYKSVPHLFENSRNSDYEYIDFIENDCRVSNSNFQ